MPEAGDITRLLQAADQGNAEAANQLYLLVEEDLRRIARRRKRAAGVGPGADASTTVLVDDAYCRLVGQDRTLWQAGDRRKFFGYMSRQMHALLIDLLRRQQAGIRGGDRQRQELDADLAAAAPGSVGLLTDLHEALTRLHEFAPEDALLFRIRFFLDCTFAETAEMLGISATASKRSFERTQLWLRRELKDYHHDA